MKYGVFFDSNGIFRFLLSSSTNSTTRFKKSSTFAGKLFIRRRTIKLKSNSKPGMYIGEKQTRSKYLYYSKLHSFNI
eukprot:UN09118